MERQTPHGMLVVRLMFGVGQLERVEFPAQMSGMDERLQIPLPGIIPFPLLQQIPHQAREKKFLGLEGHRFHSGKVRAFHHGGEINVSC